MLSPRFSPSSVRSGVAFDARIRGTGFPSRLRYPPETKRHVSERRNRSCLDREERAPEPDGLDSRACGDKRLQSRRASGPKARCRSRDCAHRGLQAAEFPHTCRERGCVFRIGDNSATPLRNSSKILSRFTDTGSSVNSWSGPNVGASLRSGSAHPIRFLGIDAPEQSSDSLPHSCDDVGCRTCAGPQLWPQKRLAAAIIRRDGRNHHPRLRQILYRRLMPDVLIGAVCGQAP